MTVPLHEQETEYLFTVSQIAVDTGNTERTVRRWIAKSHVCSVGQVSGVNVYILADVLRAKRDARKRQMLGRPRKA